MQGILRRISLALAVWLANINTALGLLRAPLVGMSNTHIWQLHLHIVQYVQQERGHLSLHQTPVFLYPDV